MHSAGALMPATHVTVVRWYAEAVNMQQVERRVRSARTPPCLQSDQAQASDPTQKKTMVEPTDDMRVHAGRL